MSWFLMFTFRTHTFCVPGSTYKICGHVYWTCTGVLVLQYLDVDDFSRHETEVQMYSSSRIRRFLLLV
jgi:hypothetical protein